MTAAASASKMTVPQLREELKSKGLDATGLKAELVARLEASRSGGADAGAPRARA
jgi:far upstream element-binding protein